MTTMIKELISEASEEVLGNLIHKFEPYTVDQELLIKLTIMRVLSLIAEEQDKADQNWQCKDGIHISWKIKDLAKDLK